VAYSDAEFGAHQSGGDRRVDIAVDEDQLRLTFLQHRLKSLHDGGGLLSVSTGTNSKIAVRFGHSELPQEDIGHCGVIMLAGMNETLAHFAVSTECAQNWCGFHEVGPCADDMENVHEFFGQGKL
jgi:hypothetical protein